MRHQRTHPRGLLPQIHDHVAVVALALVLLFSGARVVQDQVTRREIVRFDDLVIRIQRSPTPRQHVARGRCPIGTGRVEARTLGVRARDVRGAVEHPIVQAADAFARVRRTQVDQRPLDRQLRLRSRSVVDRRAT